MLVGCSVQLLGATMTRAFTNSGRGEVFVRQDRRKHEGAAPTVLCAKDDFDGLRHVLGDHWDDMSQTRREIIAEEFSEGRKGANIAAHPGTRVNTCDTHRQAAFLTRRDSVTTLGDIATAIDLPAWYDRIEEMGGRDAASQRRFVPCEKVNRSTSGGAPPQLRRRTVQLRRRPFQLSKATAPTSKATPKRTRAPVTDR